MTTHRTPLFEKQGTFFKVDDELGIAYGWAIVCAENDVPYFDLQGDHIPEAPMVEALLDFSKNSRVGKDQHAGDQTGEHVFMYPVTKATMVGLGISSPKTGAIVAYKPTNPADLDMIKNGTRTGFSIGGVLTAADETEVGKTLAKSYAAGAKKKGRVFRTFKIHEISLVDRPAQQGATVGLVKRAVASVPDFEKMMKLSSIEDGHQHIVFLDHVVPDDYGCTTYDYSSGAEDSHNHRVVIEEGVVKLSMNAGHTHAIAVPEGWIPKVPEPSKPELAPGVEVIAASAPPAVVEVPKGNLTGKATAGSVTVSPEPQEPQMTTPEQQIADLNNELKKARQFGELTDAQKLYFGKLSGVDQISFLAKSSSDRSAEVTSQVAHTGEDGTLYFKNDDPRLVNLVKTNEALAKAASKSDELRKAAQFETFAKSTIGNLAGDDATRNALAAAVMSITDDKVRDAVIATLKGADAAVDMLAKSTGHSVVGLAPTNAEQAFYAKRDEFAKASNLPAGTDTEKAVATRKFMQTPEGASLYRDFVNGQPARA